MNKMDIAYPEIEISDGERDKLEMQFLQARLQQLAAKQNQKDKDAKPANVENMEKRNAASNSEATQKEDNADGTNESDVPPPPPQEEPPEEEPADKMTTADIQTIRSCNVGGGTTTTKTMPQMSAAEAAKPTDPATTNTIVSKIGGYSPPLTFTSRGEAAFKDLADAIMASCSGFTGLQNHAGPKAAFKSDHWKPAAHKKIRAKPQRADETSWFGSSSDSEATIHDHTIDPFAALKPKLTGTSSFFNKIDTLSGLPAKASSSQNNAAASMHFADQNEPDKPKAADTTPAESSKNDPPATTTNNATTESDAKATANVELTSKMEANPAATGNIASVQNTTPHNGSVTKAEEHKETVEKDEADKPCADAPTEKKRKAPTINIKVKPDSDTAKATKIGEITIDDIANVLAAVSKSNKDHLTKHKMLKEEVSTLKAANEKHEKFNKLAHERIDVLTDAKHRTVKRLTAMKTMPLLSCNIPEQTYVLRKCNVNDEYNSQIFFNWHHRHQGKFALLANSCQKAENNGMGFCRFCFNQHPEELFELYWDKGTMCPSCKYVAILNKDFNLNDINSRELNNKDCYSPSCISKANKAGRVQKARIWIATCKGTCPRHHVIIPYDNTDKFWETTWLDLADIELAKCGLSKFTVAERAGLENSQFTQNYS